MEILYSARGQIETRDRGPSQANACDLMEAVGREGEFLVPAACECADLAVWAYRGGECKVRVLGDLVVWVDVWFGEEDNL